MFNTKVKLLVLLLIVGVSSTFAQVSVKVGDGDETVKITTAGRIYVDGATYIQDKTDLGNGVTISDVRIGLKADYKEWTTKVDMGFAKGKISPKDIFLQYNLNKTSYVRLGHYAEPFGIDHMESSGNIKFLTPSATSFAFSPGRKIGLEYIGWTKHLWYAAGLFGDGDAVKNSVQGDDGYSATGRLVFNPMKEEGKIFHVGLAGSARKADANGYGVDGYGVDGNKNPKSIGFGSPLLTNIEERKPLSAAINNANYQAKYAVELIGAYGALYVQSEYFHTNVRRYNDLATYQGKGAYAQIGFLATGGNYSYSSSWARMANPKPGALELVGRFNYTDLDDSKAQIYGGHMNDWSFAANYYLNKYMVFRLNYAYMNMGKNNPFVADEKIQSVQARVQVVF